MPKTLRYIGAEERWFETTVTGSPQMWLRNQTGSVPDNQVAALLGTGLFTLFEREQVFKQDGEVVDVGGNAVRPIPTVGPLFKGSMGRQICTWPAFSAQQGSVSLIPNPDPMPDGATSWVRVRRNASPSSTAEATVALAAYTPATGTFPSIAVKMFNPTNRVLDFRLRLWNFTNGTRNIVYGGSIKPTRKPVLVTLSPLATVQSTWNFSNPDKIEAVRVEQTDVGPNGPWLDGDELWFGEVYADVKGRARFMLTFDDVPANVLRPYPLSASAPASGRSAFQMLSYYGFKGTIYVVPDLVGGPAKVQVSDILALQEAGWAVGSHSATHPIDAIGAGLRLLGPYGYNRSRASRASGALETFTDCRVVSTNSATGVFTCENAHSMSVGSKLTFYDPAQVPAGCVLGQTYYVTAPSGANFKLATTAALANAGTGITLPSNWTGLAEWRWPGSAPDDSAIYADIKAGIDGLTALGIRGHERYFALPQGGWDHFVRSAVEKLGIAHTRGIATVSANHRSILLGWPTGGTVSSTPFWACGWPEQPDAISTDQSFSAAQVNARIDELKANGYTGANYHHSAADSAAELDALLARLKTESDGGFIDVVTVKELDEMLGVW